MTSYGYGAACNRIAAGQSSTGVTNAIYALFMSYSTGYTASQAPYLVKLD